MNKHAYLIIAHDNFILLEKLLLLLDDERNDLYLHIDLKCEEFDFQRFRDLVKKSNIIFIDRMNVKWGDCSQVEVELNLIEAAVQKNYMYYHLISGVDLPLKSQDYIHNFFEQTNGIEYVGFIHNHQHQSRIQYYHFFNTRESFNQMSLSHKCMFIFNALSLRLQKMLKVNRLKKYDLKIGKGSNWFSITHQFAKYIVDKKEFILSLCKNSTCADEIFLQTMLINSPFYHERYEEYDANSNLRLIDWQRGNPYIFTNEDYELLTQSNAIFARKFSETKDMVIINRIFEDIINN